MKYKLTVPLKSLVLPIVLTGCLLVVGYGLYSRSIPAIQPKILFNNTVAKTGTGQANVTWSPYGEQAIEVEGTNLSSTYGSQTPLPIASIAKVMTALAILKQKPLANGAQGPSIVMNNNDVSVYQTELAQNESVVPVSAGESMSEYQAIEAMLVPSATNVADTTAVWAFGSMSAYLAFANNYAEQLGMTHTHFAVDASGFSPASTSSPEDLIKLGEAAMANPVIAQIVSQSSVTLPVAGTVGNFNIDLGSAGIIGLKTGNTDQAGGAFLFAAKYQSFTIIGAIMNAPDLGTALHDAPEVITSLESNIEVEHPVSSGQEIASYKPSWTDVSIPAVAKNDLATIAWQGTTIATNATVSALHGQQKAGVVVGKVVASYDGGQSTQVFLTKPVPSPSFWWRIFHW